MEIDLKVKNISKDPLPELRAKSFSLQDSDGRRFSAYYGVTAFKDILGWIQPGLITGNRMIVFAIPYDQNLEYFLFIENKVVNLGTVYLPGEFGVQRGNLQDCNLELNESGRVPCIQYYALKYKDASACNELAEGVGLYSRNACFSRYAQKWNDIEACSMRTNGDSGCIASIAFNSCNVSLCEKSRDMQMCVDRFNLILEKNPDSC